MFGSKTCKRSDAHGARTDRFEGHTERGGVRQDHALADEAHLRLGVGELQFEFAHADEFLARAAANGGLERERDFTNHVIVEIQRHQVGADRSGEFSLRQSDVALELLSRIERIGEVNLDLPLIVDLHGLGLRDREFVKRRDAPALCA